jgi:hypothetical protein
MDDVTRFGNRILAAAGLGVTLAFLACAGLEARRQAGEPQRVNPDAKAIADFQDEVREYLELQHKLAAKLPPLPKDAPPERIDAHQRELARLIQQARRSQKPGDIFERDIRPVFRRLLHGVFTGPGGNAMRMAVMEENPGEVVKLQVNGRYPDTIPVSSVPPQVLGVLPPLPDELQYRFIGTTLILFDTTAHVIIDYLTSAVPR